MQLEDYFNFLRPDDIRLKGSRIGIETILNAASTLTKSPKVLRKINILLPQLMQTIGKKTNQN